jgi:hypothetical protein
MFSDRFLTFLGASESNTGLDGSSVGGGMLCGGGFRGCSIDGLIIMFRNGETGAFDEADSGDDPGEESVMTGESKVELVLVGEESVEVEVMEVTLSR